MGAPVPVRTTMAIGNLRSTILNRAILQIINTGHQAQYTGTPGPHKPMALELPPLGKFPTVWYFLLTRVPLIGNFLIFICLLSLIQTSLLVQHFTTGNFFLLKKCPYQYYKIIQYCGFKL